MSLNVRYTTSANVFVLLVPGCWHCLGRLWALLDKVGHWGWTLRFDRENPLPVFFLLLRVDGMWPAPSNSCHYAFTVTKFPQARSPNRSFLSVPCQLFQVAPYQVSITTQKKVRNTDIANEIPCLRRSLFMTCSCCLRSGSSGCVQANICAALLFYFPALHNYIHIKEEQLTCGSGERHSHIWWEQ